jgi:hypothetical protein
MNDRGRTVKITILCGLIALAVQSAKALEPKVGDRIPAASGEAIIVANDGGLKRGTEVLEFGQVCRIDGWTEKWLLVTRVVADWTLLEVVGPAPDNEPVVDYPTSLATECPLGTETVRPTSEVRARLNTYAKQTDDELFQSLTRFKKIHDKR